MSPPPDIMADAQGSLSLDVEAASYFDLGYTQRADEAESAAHTSVARIAIQAV